MRSGSFMKNQFLGLIEHLATGDDRYFYEVMRVLMTGNEAQVTCFWISFCCLQMKKQAKFKGLIKNAEEKLPCLENVSVAFDTMVNKYDHSSNLYRYPIRPMNH